MLQQNIFPFYWQYANVIPIPKNNKDYPPNSLLPFVSKVLEKAVLQSIIMPIADPYFKQNQFAFVPNHNTGTTNALTVLRLKIIIALTSNCAYVI